MRPGTAQQSDFGTDRDRELYVDNLRVYREWRFGELGPRLTGLNRAIIWTGGSSWNVAQCLRGGYHVCDSPPSPECTCGFYGWYRPDRRWDGGRSVLFGVAEVAGTSVLGSLGLRSQRMRPLGLVLPGLGIFGCGCTFCQMGAHAIATDQARELRDALERSLPGAGLFDTTDALLDAFPPSDWESIVGPIPAYEAPPNPFAQMATLHVQLDPAAMRRAFGQMSRQAAQSAASAQASMAPAAPQEVPLSPAQRALDARRNRSTGPGWLRDPFRRRGGSR